MKTHVNKPKGVHSITSRPLRSRKILHRHRHCTPFPTHTTASFTTATSTHSETITRSSTPQFSLSALVTSLTPAQRSQLLEKLSLSNYNLVLRTLRSEYYSSDPSVSHKPRNHLFQLPFSYPVLANASKNVDTNPTSSQPSSTDTSDPNIPISKHQLMKHFLSTVQTPYIQHIREGYHSTTRLQLLSQLPGHGEQTLTYQQQHTIRKRANDQQELKRHGKSTNLENDETLTESKVLQKKKQLEYYSRLDGIYQDQGLQLTPQHPNPFLNRGIGVKRFVQMLSSLWATHCALASAVDSNWAKLIPEDKYEGIIKVFASLGYHHERNILNLTKLSIIQKLIQHRRVKLPTLTGSSVDGMNKYRNYVTNEEDNLSKMQKDNLSMLQTTDVSAFTYDKLEDNDIFMSPSTIPYPPPNENDHNHNEKLTHTTIDPVAVDLIYYDKANSDHSDIFLSSLNSIINNHLIDSQVHKIKTNMGETPSVDTSLHDQELLDYDDTVLTSDILNELINLYPNKNFSKLLEAFTHADAEHDRPLNIDFINNDEETSEIRQDSDLLYQIGSKHTVNHLKHGTWLLFQAPVFGTDFDLQTQYRNVLNQELSEDFFSILPPEQREKYHNCLKLQSQNPYDYLTWDMSKLQDIDHIHVQTQIAMNQYNKELDDRLHPSKKPKHTNKLAPNDYLAEFLYPNMVLPPEQRENIAILCEGMEFDLKNNIKRKVIPEESLGAKLHCFKPVTYEDNLVSTGAYEKIRKKFNIHYLDPAEHNNILSKVVDTPTGTPVFDIQDGYYMQIKHEVNQTAELLKPLNEKSVLITTTNNEGESDKLILSNAMNALSVGDTKQLLKDSQYQYRLWESYLQEIMTPFTGTPKLVPQKDYELQRELKQKRSPAQAFEDVYTSDTCSELHRKKTKINVDNNDENTGKGNDDEATVHDQRSFSLRGNADFVVRAGHIYEYVKDPINPDNLIKRKKYLYELWDTKLRRDLQAKDVLQTLTYATILNNQLQNEYDSDVAHYAQDNEKIKKADIPPTAQITHVCIVNGHGKIARIPLNAAYTQLIARMSAVFQYFLKQFHPLNPPTLPNSSSQAGYFSDFTSSIWEYGQLLPLITELRDTRIQALLNNGFTSIPDAAMALLYHTRVHRNGSTASSGSAKNDDGTLKTDLSGIRDTVVYLPTITGQTEDIVFDNLFHETYKYTKNGAGDGELKYRVNLEDAVNGLNEPLQLLYNEEYNMQLGAKQSELYQNTIIDHHGHIVGAGHSTSNWGSPTARLNQRNAITTNKMKLDIPGYTPMTLHDFNRYVNTLRYELCELLHNTGIITINEDTAHHYFKHSTIESVRTSRPPKLTPSGEIATNNFSNIVRMNHSINFDQYGKDLDNFSLSHDEINLDMESGTQKSTLFNTIITEPDVLYNSIDNILPKLDQISHLSKLSADTLITLPHETAVQIVLLHLKKQLKDIYNVFYHFSITNPAFHQQFMDKINSIQTQSQPPTSSNEMILHPLQSLMLFNPKNHAFSLIRHNGLTVVPKPCPLGGDVYLDLEGAGNVVDVDNLVLATFSNKAIASKTTASIRKNYIQQMSKFYSIRALVKLDYLYGLCYKQTLKQWLQAHNINGIGVDKLSKKQLLFKKVEQNVYAISISEPLNTLKVYNSDEPALNNHGRPLVRSETIYVYIDFKENNDENVQISAENTKKRRKIAKSVKVLDIRARTAIDKDGDFDISFQYPTLHSKKKSQITESDDKMVSSTVKDLLSTFISLIKVHHSPEMEAAFLENMVEKSENQKSKKMMATKVKDTFDLTPDEAAQVYDQIKDSAITIFHDFWGHTPAQELAAYDEVINFLVQRKKQYPLSHVYHYAIYESNAIKSNLIRLGSDKGKEVLQLVNDQINIITNTNQQLTYPSTLTSNDISTEDVQSETIQLSQSKAPASSESPYNHKMLQFKTLINNIIIQCQRINEIYTHIVSYLGPIEELVRENTLKMEELMRQSKLSTDNDQKVAYNDQIYRIMSEQMVLQQKQLTLVNKLIDTTQTAQQIIAKSELIIAQKLSAYQLSQQNQPSAEGNVSIPDELIMQYNAQINSVKNDLISPINHILSKYNLNTGDINVSTTSTTPLSTPSRQFSTSTHTGYTSNRSFFRISPPSLLSSAQLRAVRTSSLVTVTTASRSFSDLPVPQHNPKKSKNAPDSSLASEKTKKRKNTTTFGFMTSVVKPIGGSVPAANTQSSDVLKKAGIVDGTSAQLAPSPSSSSSRVKKQAPRSDIDSLYHLHDRFSQQKPQKNEELNVILENIDSIGDYDDGDDDDVISIRLKQLQNKKNQVQHTNRKHHHFTFSFPSSVHADERTNSLDQNTKAPPSQQHYKQQRFKIINESLLPQFSTKLEHFDDLYHFVLTFSYSSSVKRLTKQAIIGRQIYNINALRGELLSTLNETNHKLNIIKKLNTIPLYHDEFVAHLEATYNDKGLVDKNGVLKVFNIEKDEMYQQFKHLFIQIPPSLKFPQDNPLKKGAMYQKINMRYIHNNNLINPNEIDLIEIDKYNDCIHSLQERLKTYIKSVLILSAQLLFMSAEQNNVILDPQQPHQYDESYSTSYNEMQVHYVYKKLAHILLPKLELDQILEKSVLKNKISVSSSPKRKFYNYDGHENQQNPVTVSSLSLNENRELDVNALTFDSVLNHKKDTGEDGESEKNEKNISKKAIICHPEDYYVNYDEIQREVLRDLTQRYNITKQNLYDGVLYQSIHQKTLLQSQNMLKNLLNNSIDALYTYQQADPTKFLLGEKLSAMLESYSIKIDNPFTKSPSKTPQKSTPNIPSLFNEVDTSQLTQSIKNHAQHIEHLKLASLHKTDDILDPSQQRLMNNEYFSSKILSSAYNTAAEPKSSTKWGLKDESAISHADLPHFTPDGVLDKNVIDYHIDKLSEDISSAREILMNSYGGIEGYIDLHKKQSNLVSQTLLSNVHNINSTPTELFNKIVSTVDDTVSSAVADAVNHEAAVEKQKRVPIHPLSHKSRQIPRVVVPVTANPYHAFEADRDHVLNSAKVTIPANQLNRQALLGMPESSNSHEALVERFRAQQEALAPRSSKRQKLSAAQALSKLTAVKYDYSEDSPPSRRSFSSSAEIFSPSTHDTDDSGHNNHNGNDNTQNTSSTTLFSGSFRPSHITYARKKGVIEPKSQNPPDENEYNLISDDNINPDKVEYFQTKINQDLITADKIHDIFLELGTHPSVKSPGDTEDTIAEPAPKKRGRPRKTPEMPPTTAATAKSTSNSKTTKTSIRQLLSPDLTDKLNGQLRKLYAKSFAMHNKAPSNFQIRDTCVKFYQQNGVDYQMFFRQSKEGNSGGEIVLNETTPVKTVIQSTTIDPPITSVHRGRKQATKKDPETPTDFVKTGPRIKPKKIPESKLNTTSAKKGVFFDIYPVVRHNIRLSTKSSSLKEVEKLVLSPLQQRKIFLTAQEFLSTPSQLSNSTDNDLGNQRSGDVTHAHDSLVAYYTWRFKHLSVHKYMSILTDMALEASKSTENGKLSYKFPTRDEFYQHELFTHVHNSANAPLNTEYITKNDIKGAQTIKKNDLPLNIAPFAVETPQYFTPTSFFPRLSSPLPQPIPSTTASFNDELISLREYNKQDCVHLMSLTEWIWDLQRQHESLLSASQVSFIEPADFTGDGNSPQEASVQCQQPHSTVSSTGTQQIAMTSDLNRISRVSHDIVITNNLMNTIENTLDGLQTELSTLDNFIMLLDNLDVDDIQTENNNNIGHVLPTDIIDGGVSRKM